MRAAPGDKGAVLRRLSLLVAVSSLAGLAIASPAIGAGGSLIAPTAVCAGQGLDAPAEAQESAMLCMTDYARAQTGQAALTTAPALDESADDKGADILRCDSFSHFASIRKRYIRSRESSSIFCHCWRSGWNCGRGECRYPSVRPIFRAWMSSPGHRENILGDFTQIGISLQVGTLAGLPQTHVWAQHFGSTC